MAHPLVVHSKLYSGEATYVGRPTKWGNCFMIGRDGTREEGITKYRDWIHTQPDLMAALPELRGKVLSYWCAPSSWLANAPADLS